MGCGFSEEDQTESENSEHRRVEAREEPDNNNNNRRNEDRKERTDSSASCRATPGSRQCSCVEGQLFFKQLHRVSSFPQGVLCRSGWLGLWNTETLCEKCDCVEQMQISVSQQVTVVVKEIEMPLANRDRIQKAVEDLARYRNCTNRILQPVLRSVRCGNTIKVCTPYLSQGSIAAAEGVMIQDQVERVLHRLLLGLRFLHEQKLPHRHLTMDNILISDHGCVLSDCALGALFAQMTAAEIFEMGYRSASVFPPETITDRAPEDGFDDEKCDIWSFGCVAFRLAFGHEPFVGETKEKLFESIRNDDVRFPPHAEVTPEQRSLFNESLSKDPRKRSAARTLVHHSFLSMAAHLTSFRSMESRSLADEAVRGFCRCLSPMIPTSSSSALASTLNSTYRFGSSASSGDLREGFQLTGRELVCSNCRKELERHFRACVECECYALCVRCASLGMEHCHTLYAFIVDRTTLESVGSAAGKKAATPEKSPPAPPGKDSPRKKSPLDIYHRIRSPEEQAFGHFDESFSSTNIQSPPETPREEFSLPPPPQSPIALRCMQHHERQDAHQAIRPEQAIEECASRHLPNLELFSMGLMRIPFEAISCNTIHILSLDLTNNHIEEIPPEIGSLRSLKKLMLGENTLRSLPETIGNLLQLERLDANNNQLCDLPQDFMFLDSLSHLSLDYNCFTHIPEVVFDIISLRTLYLAANDLTHWPPLELLAGCTSLEIGLDNEPSLCREYHANRGSMKGIFVLWNNIYPDEVVPGLFCGSLRSVQTPQVYSRLHITHILTAGRALEVLVLDGMKQFTLLVDDFEGATITNTFDDAFKFIDDAVNSEGNCLVHCFAGISRSSSVIIAYLMKRHRMRLDDAYNLVKKARPAIYPNDGFLRQLVAFDKNLFPEGRSLDFASLRRGEIPM